MEPTERLIVRRGTDRETVDRAAFFANWDVAEIYPADEDQPYEKVYRPAAPDTWVHYIEDPVLEISYLVAKGANARAALDEIHAKVPVYGTEELREGSSDEARLKLAVAAITGQNDSEGQWKKTVLEGMQHPDAAVRRQAILAVGYLRGSEFEKPLERLAGEEPDPEVRADAAAMLDLLRSANQIGLSE